VSVVEGLEVGASRHSSPINHSQQQEAQGQ
jgi:hypothetical protein